MRANAFTIIAAALAVVVAARPTNPSTQARETLEEAGKLFPNHLHTQRNTPQLNFASASSAVHARELIKYRKSSRQDHGTLYPLSL